MNRFGWLILGVLLGAGCVHGALNYHVLNTKDGLQLVPKTSASLGDTYVDIRSFTLTQWGEHPQLAKAITMANKQHLFQSSATESIQQGVTNLFQDLSGQRR